MICLQHKTKIGWALPEAAKSTTCHIVYMGLGLLRSDQGSPELVRSTSPSSSFATGEMRLCYWGNCPFDAASKCNTLAHLHKVCLCSRVSYSSGKLTLPCQNWALEHYTNVLCLGLSYINRLLKRVSLTKVLKEERAKTLPLRTTFSYSVSSGTLHRAREKLVAVPSDR